MRLPVRRVEDVVLNTASEEELCDDVGLGPERARRIVERRPFHDWDEVKRIEGFTAVIVDNLRAAGAQLGDPNEAVIQRISEAHHDEMHLTRSAGMDLDEGVLAEGRKGMGPYRRVS